MEIDIRYQPYNLYFKFDAGTSRGIMRQHQVMYIKVVNKHNRTQYGIGEAAPLPGLSVDDIDGVQQAVQSISSTHNLTLNHLLEIIRSQQLKLFPSLQFALETAIKDLENGGEHVIFPNDFANSLSSIPINGLVWMADFETMLAQIQQKIAEGYTCIKLKVGAIDFDQELAMIKNIRKEYSSKQIILRLDANGAWNVDEALKKLESLALYDIHSIEQPIKAGQEQQMKHICRESPIKIALDEELIGIYEFEKKKNLITEINPHYIILKPTLLGGFAQCSQWIALANQYGIGWWATSALESNFGLNAICQYTDTHNLTGMYQGLGTGQLYHNNIPSPLTIESGKIFWDKDKTWKKIMD